MGVSELTDLLLAFCLITRVEGRKVWLFLLSDVLGAGESQAEGEGGAGETAGSAGALQEVFDITQHSLGQGADQRAHAEVTSEAQSATAAKPGVPLHVKALEGRRSCLVACQVSHRLVRFSG